MGVGKMVLLRKIRLLVKYMVMYLTMLSPRSKKIVVFGAWLGDKFADNAKVLFLEAQEDKELTTIWITRNPKVVEEVRDAGYKAYGWCSIKGIWYQLRAGYAVMTNGISDFKHAFLGGVTLINLWHGIPLKKVGYDDYYEKDWDSKPQRFRDKIIHVPLGKEYVVATSQTIAKIYESAFRVSANRVICLGQPRNDVFFDTSLMEKVRGSQKEIGIEQGKHIQILYAPTHRKEGKIPIELSRIFDLEQLNDFCEKNQCDFLIKKHFYHRNEVENLQKYPRIKDITGESWDTQELLMKTDVLVTDYSSIYIDYLLLDRPMLFYHYDYEAYLQTDREMYFKYEDVTPGERAGEFKQFMEGLERIMKNGREHQKTEREQVRNLFYCKEGQGPVGKILLEKMKN